jgi:hypothetical protein
MHQACMRPAATSVCGLKLLVYEATFLAVVDEMLLMNSEVEFTFRYSSDTPSCVRSAYTRMRSRMSQAPGVRGLKPLAHEEAISY